MTILNINKILRFYFIALSTGLTVSACSAEPVDTAYSIEESDTSQSYQLGLNYYEGKSIKQDYNKAFELFQEAANQGYPQAQFQLGVMYDNGEGVSEDKNKAAQWYKKAAEQGLADAQNKIGVKYFYSEDVERNYDKAIKWFKKAVNRPGIVGDLIF